MTKPIHMEKIAGQFVHSIRSRTNLALCAMALSIVTQSGHLFAAEDIELPLMEPKVFEKQAVIPGVPRPLLPHESQALIDDTQASGLKARQVSHQEEPPTCSSPDCSKEQPCPTCKAVKNIRDTSERESNEAAKRTVRQGLQKREEAMTAEVERVHDLIERIGNGEKVDWSDENLTPPSQHLLTRLQNASESASGEELSQMADRAHKVLRERTQEVKRRLAEVRERINVAHKNLDDDGDDHPHSHDQHGHHHDGNHDSHDHQARGEHHGKKKLTGTTGDGEQCESGQCRRPTECNCGEEGCARCGHGKGRSHTEHGKTDKGRHGPERHRPEGHRPEGHRPEGHRPDRDAGWFGQHASHPGPGGPHGMMGGPGMGRPDWTRANAQLQAMTPQKHAMIAAMHLKAAGMNDLAAQAYMEAKKMSPPSHGGNDEVLKILKEMQGQIKELREDIEHIHEEVEEILSEVGED